MNGQVFILLDEIQEEIGAFPIKPVFDDGSEVGINDLQLYPTTCDVSFRLVNSPSRPANVT